MKLHPLDRYLKADHDLRIQNCTAILLSGHEALASEATRLLDDELRRCEELGCVRPTANR